MTRAPIVPDERRRLSARRLYERHARRALRAMERVVGPGAAVPFYRSLLDAQAVDAGPIAHRLALCLERTGRLEAAVQICMHARNAQPDTASALALDRTGRRIARRAKCPWTPLPALRAAPVADLHPPQTMTFEGGYEQALCDALHLAGRRAVHGENAPWRTLFGLLFYDVIFAPIAGMLPTAFLHAPIDLATTSFYRRRSAQIERRLEEIRSGGAQACIAEFGTEHHGEAIAGVNWNLFNINELCEIAASIGGVAVAAMMEIYAHDWRGAGRGMPDLCILPGPPRVFHGITIGPGLILAEVKGPTDTLRDGQRLWHHHLLSAGVSAEVWRVRLA